MWWVAMLGDNQGVLLIQFNDGIYIILGWIGKLFSQSGQPKVYFKLCWARCEEIRIEFSKCRVNGRWPPSIRVKVGRGDGRKKSKQGKQTFVRCGLVWISGRPNAFMLWGKRSPGHPACNLMVSFTNIVGVVSSVTKNIRGADYPALF